LKWGDIDFDDRKGKIVVTSPKTEHHQGKETRIIHLFPELRKPLVDVFAEAEEGSEHVITQYCWANSNLRTQLERIMKRAGVTAWPKLFNNLRASCDTELQADHPAHVVSVWVGHSVKVSNDHYARVRDSDFEQAVAGAIPAVVASAESGDKPASSAAQNPAQQPPAHAVNVRKSENSSEAQPLDLPDVSETCGSLQEDFLGAEGFEPSKAEPSDLQSDPFVHFGTRPLPPLQSGARIMTNSAG
jgi:hypothetical protein